MASSLTVSLAVLEPLQPRRAPKFKPLAEWRSEHRGKIGAVIGAESTVEPLSIQGETNNQFVNAVLYAYNTHSTLVLSPEDFHICLQLAFSSCVESHAEEMRSVFVDHDGKKKLVFQTGAPPGCYDWPFLVAGLEKMLAEHLKTDVNLTPNYSTTEAHHLTASKLLRLAAFKSILV